MRKVLLLLAVISFVGISSCKKDSNDAVKCSGLWGTEVIDEYSALTTAAMAYSTSQTPANCVAYKEAYQDYVDALEPYLECSEFTDAEREDLEEEIADAEATIDELDCTE